MTIRNKPANLILMSIFSLISSLLIINSLTAQAHLVNVGPTDIHLTNEFAFPDNLLSYEGREYIGELRTTDANTEDLHTYSFEVPGNAEIFEIYGDKLYFSLEAYSNLLPAKYPVTITSSDGEFSFSRTFTITIIDDSFPRQDSFGSREINYRIVAPPVSTIEFYAFINNGIKGVHFEVYEFHPVFGAGIFSANNTLMGGVGYWLIRESSPWASYGNQFNVPAANLNQRGEFEMPLKPGWNLIGNPFREPINWTAELDYNVAAGFIQEGDVSQAYVYQGAYSVEDSLQVYQGAFVWAKAETTFFLRKKGYYSDESNRSFTSQRMSSTSSDDWQLSIHMTNGEQTTNIPGIGMRTNASDDLDHYDRSTPPSLSDKYTFQWEDKQGLSQNIVSINDMHIWEYEIRTNQKGVTLSWDIDLVATLQKELWLELQPQGKIVNMSNVGFVTYRPSANQIARIHYGISPEKDAIHVYPNPSTFESTIHLNSGVVGLAQINVHDITGRKVKIEQRLISENNSAWVWDLRDDAGQLLPRGMYFYEICIEGGKSLSTKLLIN